MGQALTFFNHRHQYLQCQIWTALNIYMHIACKSSHLCKFLWRQTEVLTRWLPPALWDDEKNLWYSITNVGWLFKGGPTSNKAGSTALAFSWLKVRNKACESMKKHLSVERKHSLYKDKLTYVAQHEPYICLWLIDPGGEEELTSKNWY